MKFTTLAGCFLGLAVFSSAFGEELGRLFFTPEQRAQFDYNYAQRGRADNDLAITLNGIVQKHGGKRTIWINGVEQQAGGSDDKTPDLAPVQVPGQNKSVKLKVGQRVLLKPSALPDKAKPDLSHTPEQ